MTVNTTGFPVALIARICSDWSPGKLSTARLRASPERILSSPPKYSTTSACFAKRAKVAIFSLLNSRDQCSPFCSINMILPSLAKSRKAIIGVIVIASSLSKHHVPFCS